MLQPQTLTAQYSMVFDGSLGKPRALARAARTVRRRARCVRRRALCAAARAMCAARALTMDALPRVMTDVALLLLQLPFLVKVLIALRVWELRCRSSACLLPRADGRSDGAAGARVPLWPSLCQLAVHVDRGGDGAGFPLSEQLRIAVSGCSSGVGDARLLLSSVGSAVVLAAGE